LSEKPIEGEKPSILASRKVYAILIAALLISVGAIFYVWLASPIVKTESLPIVESGDMVYVTYVGYFADHPGGWIFDTNDRFVAMNESIMKSLYFQTRDPKEYTPLNFTAGTATNLLKPFVDGVVGMTVTQTKRVFIPIDQGYPIVQDYAKILPIIMTANVIEQMNVTDFENLYGDTPSVGLVERHYFWEWDTIVIGVSGDLVVVQNEPKVGQKISSFGDPGNNSRDGWYQEVVSIDPAANGGNGNIIVNNLITPQDVYQKGGADFDERKFTLVDVNETTGNFIILFNTEGYIGELAGRAIYFDVTVTRVLKS